MRLHILRLQIMEGINLLRKYPVTLDIRRRRLQNRHYQNRHLRRPNLALGARGHRRPRCLLQLGVVESILLKKQVEGLSQ